MNIQDIQQKVEKGTFLNTELFISIGLRKNAHFLHNLHEFTFTGQYEGVCTQEFNLSIVLCSSRYYFNVFKTQILILNQFLKPLNILAILEIAFLTFISYLYWQINTLSNEHLNRDNFVCVLTIFWTRFWKYDLKT